METKIKNADIHHETKGTGTPILVLGGPWLGHAYLRSMDVLSDAHRLIYPDPRGTGHTPLGGRALMLDGLIADLEMLRESLGIACWSVIGHSFGAHVAMLYAGKHPDRVTSLVVANAGPPLGEDLMKRFFSEMMSRRTRDDMQEMEAIERSGAFARRDIKAVERSFLLTYLPFFDDRQSAEAFDLGFTETTAKNAPGTEMRLFQELGTLDPIGNLARITCPTLIVHAAHDPLPEDWSRLLAQHIKGARLAVLKNANHFAFIEQPEAFFGVVKPFLDKNAK